MERKKENFKDYYQYYLTLHQNKWCRRLHAIGQVATISYIILCVSYSLWIPLIFTPFIVYPFAWIGHVIFEKNEPAAWKGTRDYGWTTLKAKACDWIMLKDIITGKVKW